MKLVLTLLARDEADVVDATIAFHLDAGVDFIIATDNASTDGTTDILASHERAGHLHLIRETGDNMQQGAWVTRMARLAATDFGADWVINSDADEFWCSHGAAIKDVLAEVPQRFGTVRALMRNFVPRPGGGNLVDRMNVRLVPGEVGEARFRVHPFHAQDKVIHRAHPDVTINEGNHEARWPGSVDLRGAWPFEVLHFPMRSAEQCEQKWRNYERHGYAGYDVLTNYDAREYYESLVVDDTSSAGYVIDNRLRDALRSGDGYLAPLTLDDAAAIAADATAASERDALVQGLRRARELETRVNAVEGFRLTRRTSRRPRRDLTR
jgi:Glycosyl transferase family 2